MRGKRSLDQSRRPLRPPQHGHGEPDAPPSAGAVRFSGPALRELRILLDHLEAKRNGQDSPVASDPLPGDGDDAPGPGRQLA
jgi:hypothetical protein